MSSKGQIKLLTDAEFACYLKGKENPLDLISSLSATPDPSLQENRLQEADSLLRRENDEQITRHLKQLKLVTVQGKLTPKSSLYLKPFTPDGLKASVDRLYSNPLMRKRRSAAASKPGSISNKGELSRPSKETKDRLSVPHLQFKLESFFSTSDFTRQVETSKDDLTQPSAPSEPMHKSEWGREDIGRSGNTLTQTSSPNWLTSSLGNYLKTASQPQVSRSTISTPRSLTRKAKKSPSKKKRSLPEEFERQMQTHGHLFEEHVQKKARKKQQMLADLNKLCLDEGRSTKWGDFVGVVYAPKKSSETLPDSLEELEKLRALNERMFRTMGQSPAELYRIISRKNFLQDKLNSPTALLRNENWTEEHESAFKDLVRKTHPKNPIVKTMRFRAVEKSLPAEKHNLNTEWKYDKRSPWVNDLDYHDRNYLTLEEEKTKHGKRKHISNIKTAIRDESSEIDPEELKIQELLIKTGQTEAKNLNSLQDLAGQIDRVNDYQDAVKCFDQVKRWRKSKAKAEAAKLKMADYVEAEKKVDSKELSKARYSYLSSKIAAQRANAELLEKMLTQADERRVELRKQQEEFQRVLTPMRAVVRRMFGNCYMSKGRRALRLTSFSKGHPLFIPTMVKMGLLPATIEAKPERLRPGTVIISKQEKATISPSSQKNLSKLNFPSFKPKTTQPTKQAIQNQAAIKIQRRVRGYIARRWLLSMKEAVVRLQRLARRRSSRKMLHERIVKAVMSGKYANVSSLVARHYNSGLFMKVVRSKAGSTEAFNKALSKHIQRSKSMTQDQTETPMSVSYLASRRNHHKMVPITPPDVHQNTPQIRSKSRKPTISALPELHVTSPVITQASPKSLQSPQPKSRREVAPLDFKGLSDIDRLNLIGKANRINATVEEIRKHRAEMWSCFLSGLRGAQVEDQDLVKLLAKNSLYLGKIGDDKAWEDTLLKLPFNDGKVTPEELMGLDPDEILIALSTELRRALESKEAAKAKYKSTQLAWEQFASVNLPSTLPKAGQLKNFEALLTYSKSSTSKLLAKSSQLDRLALEEVLAIASSLEDHIR
jgi:hypothetical protein